MTVLFKDGRRLAGQPIKGTNDPALATQQLYLTYCRWWLDDAGTWEGVNESAPVGVLVNLGEVLTISTIEPPGRAAHPTSDATRPPVPGGRPADPPAT